MLPVSLKGLKASAALFPLLRQARGKQQQLNGEEESNSNNNSPAKMMALGRRFHELRLQQGAPHPFWIIGSPLVQLPLFITSMAAIRGMAVQGWPGFSSGGVAWFPNLTLPAMDLTSLTAPMGMARKYYLLFFVFSVDFLLIKLFILFILQAWKGPFSQSPLQHQCMQTSMLHLGIQNAVQQLSQPVLTNNNHHHHHRRHRR